MAKENERIGFEKAENGYIITHSWEENKDKNYNYVSKKYVTKTAKDTQEKIK